MEQKGEVADDSFEIFELFEANGKHHSALHIPRNLPSSYVPEDAVDARDIINIFMGDVSGSMCTYWPKVVEGWQEHIQDKLTGTTKLFVFGSEVTFLREDTAITNEDNLGGGTDLTRALRTVREEVDKCSQSIVRVFIVTDGAHGYGEPLPETEIEKMMPPSGKTVSIYLLGIGMGFPVNISIDMRSKMHNGNSNIPALFWAKSSVDIFDQVRAIGDELMSALVKLKLSVEGHILPGLNKTNDVHLGEWIYFEQPPEEIPPIAIAVNDEPEKPVSYTVKPVTMRHLLDCLFRQWNSVLIQQHRKKAHVPRENFELMDSLFRYHMDIFKSEMPTGQDVKSRLMRKRVKACEVEYRTLMNQSKTIIDVEGQFKDELELADIILKSTVTNRKYDTKNLRLKGHTQDKYEDDLVDFRKVYEKAKPKIMALPPPVPEECCRVIITSTLSDLQDPDFTLMLEESKFDLLKTFTMTGIPVYAPVRDASQINPWTLIIKHVLVTPFTILCQQVLEQSAATDIANLGDEDKDVVLQQDNEKTRFNAIIPLVPAHACEALKPIVLSNFYAMMSTFCILKNPHILDFNAHIAALGCVWLRTVREFPAENRPEFAVERLASIIATADLYLGRPSITRYIDTLINHPKQALMTESEVEFDGKTLKCESLIKPAFFSYLRKDKFSVEQRTSLLEVMAYEFIGRCLSSYKADDSEACPYTDFFCKQLAIKENRTEWLSRHCKEITDGFQTMQGNFLERYFTLEDLIPDLKKYVSQQVQALTDKVLKELVIEVDMKQVNKLRSYSSCGNIMFTAFPTWAREMEIPEEKIEEIFNPTKVMAYVNMALQFRSSRDRLSKDLPSSEGVLDIVSKKVLQENLRTLKSTISKEVEEYGIKQWKDAYLVVHRPLVMPLTMQQVIEIAQGKGIEVTQDTFKKVYRYSEHVGLVRNACQIPECPHYLKPHNNFNQHLSIEREQGNFPHALHLVSHDFCGQGFDNVVSEVLSGKHAGTQNRKLPSPPTSGTLEPLTVQLKELLVLYSKNEQNSSGVFQSPQQIEEDEDDFYDCY